MEPGFGIGDFHDFSHMNLGGNELMQGRWEMQKDFDFLTGQLSR